MAHDTTSMILHATCVAVGARGLLIVGPSGAGKSSLAIQMIACGAELVADDRCHLQRTGDGISVTRPPSLPTGIEARGIGILNAPMRDSATLCYCVDLTQTERDRLPEPHVHEILGLTVRCFAKTELDAFAQSLYLLLKYGENERVTSVTGQGPTEQRSH